MWDFPRMQVGQTIPASVLSLGTSRKGRLQRTAALGGMMPAVNDLAVCCGDIGE